MKIRKYHLRLGGTSACTKITIEATKGIGHRDIKGATKDLFFLEVGSPQRSCQKL